jgi:hypothetical protein
MILVQRALSCLSVLVLAGFGLLFTTILVRFERPSAMGWTIFAVFAVPALAHSLGAVLSWPRGGAQTSRRRWRIGLSLCVFASIAWALLLASSLLGSAASDSLAASPTKAAPLFGLVLASALANAMRSTAMLRVQRT